MADALTHFDEAGHPQMVDVTQKQDTHREAVAEARVRMRTETRRLIDNAMVKKGDVIQVAELAGIMGAKKTSELVPLCHPLPLSNVTVACTWDDSPREEEAILRIVATVKTHYRTGVEMEALTAAATAALTVYDMCKAADRGMSIQDLQLVAKSGGKSGVYLRSETS